MLGFERLWKREMPESPALPAQSFTPRPVQPEPIRDQYHGDDGLTDVQRAMRSFGLCELQHKWPSEIAAEFVAYQREWGFCDYPYLSADLDDELAAFCKSRNYLMQSFQQLREAVSAQPGVGPPRRERLSRHNPKHRFILQRQMARGSTNDRPTLYYISATVPTPAYGQHEPWYAHGEAEPATASPPPAKAKSGPGRPRKGKAAGKPRPVEEVPEFQPQRQAA